MIAIMLVLLFQQPQDSFGNQESNRTKVILIGLGGATWKVILPLIEKGELPNITRLINNGSAGELYAPVADLCSLTSIVTGSKEEKHAVFEHCVKITKEYKAPFIPSYVRRTRAIWNILSDYNRTIGVINWWATCPAEKVKGFIISNAFCSPKYFQKDSPFIFSKYPLVYPAYLQKRLEKQLPLDYEIMGELVNILGYMPEKEWVVFPAQKRFYAKIDYLSMEFKERSTLDNLKMFLENDLFVFKLGKYLLKRENPDFFSAFFWGLDITQHCFWEFYEAGGQGCSFEPSEEEVEKFGQVIPRYYQFMDKFVGEILDEYNKEQNVVVIVVSDHGFRCQPAWRDRKQFKLNFIFEKLGWLKYKNNGEIDWAKTKIYDFPHRVPAHPDRKVYVNLKERDLKGIIRPGDEYTSFLEEVIKKLGMIKTIGGEKVFDKIEKLDSAGTLPLIQPPDLLVEFNQSISLNAKIKINDEIYPVTKFMIPWPRSGTHDNNGIIIVSGSGIRKGKIEKAAVYDVAPTILDLMGVSAEKEMDGRALTEIIQKSESPEKIPY